LRIFEQYLYATLHAADDTVDGNDHSVAIRDRLAGYRRLIDLLDFLQTLLRVKPRQNSGTQAGNENVPSLIPPERGTDPLTVDWYCCFAIDVPQPRHHDGEDRSGDKRINRISYADLTYFALQRFCQDLQTVLGCRLYNVPFSASFSNEPDARFPFPNVAFPQSLRIGVTRIPPPKTEKLKPPKPSVLPQPLEKLCRELQEINTGKFPTDQGMQKPGLAPTKSFAQ
jgi:hypothetical protein